MFIWNTAPLMLTARKILKLSITPGQSVWAKAYEADHIFMYGFLGQASVIVIYFTVSCTFLYSSVFGSDNALLSLNGVLALLEAVYEFISL